jgi:hypothetical protein
LPYRWWMHRQVRGRLPGVWRLSSSALASSALAGPDAGLVGCRTGAGTSNFMTESEVWCSVKMGTCCHGGTASPSTGVSTWRAEFHTLGSPAFRLLANSTTPMYSSGGAPPAEQPGQPGPVQVGMGPVKMTGRPLAAQAHGPIR